MRMKKYRDIWPIDERAATPPSGWPGWPDGKKFALVLTHDVEKQGGVEKCLQLMEIEKKFGFRSSFNFVPHDYVVPKELRKRLTDSGFEVGVHGLTHDGNMFRDRALFERQSVLINKYLKDWGSVGFRAPSMYHNLEWILDLREQPTHGLSALRVDDTTCGRAPVAQASIGEIAWVPASGPRTGVMASSRRGPVGGLGGADISGLTRFCPGSDIPDRDGGFP